MTTRQEFETRLVVLPQITKTTDNYYAAGNEGLAKLSAEGWRAISFLLRGGDLVALIERPLPSS